MLILLIVVAAVAFELLLAVAVGKLLAGRTQPGTAKVVPAPAQSGTLSMPALSLPAIGLQP